jgi:hypothetical protein
MMAGILGDFQMATCLDMRYSPGNQPQMSQPFPLSTEAGLTFPAKCQLMYVAGEPNLKAYNVVLYSRCKESLSSEMTWKIIINFLMQEAQILEKRES